MANSKNIFHTTLVFFCFAILFSCTYSQTFQPQFNDNQTAIIDSINGKYGFKDINVNGKKTSGSGGGHTALTVKFINGKNIPNNDDSVTSRALKSQ